MPKKEGKRITLTKKEIEESQKRFQEQLESDPKGKELYEWEEKEKKKPEKKMKGGKDD